MTGAAGRIDGMCVVVEWSDQWSRTNVVLAVAQLLQLTGYLFASIVNGLDIIIAGFFGHHDVPLHFYGEFGILDAGIFTGDHIYMKDVMMKSIEVFCTFYCGLMFFIGQLTMAGGDMDIHVVLLGVLNCDEK